MSLDAPSCLPGTAPYAPGWDRTEVSRPVAIALSVAFAAGLLIVPLADGLLGAWRQPWQAAVAAGDKVTRALGGSAPWSRRLLDANRAALAGIGNFETTMEDSSALVAAVRPATLDALLRFGGAGSEEAYMGRGGWLFYRPDVDALLRPAARLETAAQGVAEFAADLAQRGIRLVLVPTPGKASIHPEQIARGRDRGNAPLMPSGWDTFGENLQSAWKKAEAARDLPDELAPVVVDPSRLLRERAVSSGEAQYLVNDSHWSPSAMEAVAAEIATAAGGARAMTEPQPVRPIEGLGDTARMLELPAGSPLLQTQEVIVSPVEGWMPDREAPLLLLGDSYTNIYSAEDLGWGTGAGLAERLSQRLGYRVDRLSRNDAGALSARRMLAAETARDPAWLGGKKVIVWQLALRELVDGDWSPVELPSATPMAPADFLVVPPGAPQEVTATVADLGPLPQRGATPYREYLTAVHLTDLQDAAGNKLDGEAVAYVFTMRDLELLPAAAVKSGDRVRVRLVNYDENAALLDSLNRGELDDVELMLQTPNFAEWIFPAAP